MAALLLGWVVLGQQVGVFQRVGATLVIGAILLLARQKAPQRS